VTGLLGFIQCEEQQTLRGLLRQVAGARALASLSRFFAQAPWSSWQAAQAWLRRFRDQMTPSSRQPMRTSGQVAPKRVGRPKKTVVTGFLVIDDSPHEKPKGKVMEGLGVHYSTTEGKQVRGHSLLTGLYLLLGRRCPLPPLLYRQRVVAQAEGVRFLSKIDLAEKIIRTSRPVPGTHTHVLVDAWYICKRLWKVARGRGFAFTGGLKGNRQLRVEGSQGWMRLSEYAASLGPGQYQKVIWPAQQAPREVWAHLVPARVRKPGRCQVLIVRDSLDAPIQQARYWATSERNASLEEVIGWAASRWEIETFFGDVKELLGTDHDQVQSATALLRFWHLPFCTYLYLDEVRAQLAVQRPDDHITIGEARRYHQALHRQRFLEWAWHRYQRGVPELPSRGVEFRIRRRPPG
jgi:hypothetical protein